MDSATPAYLPHNILSFGRVLRGAGIPVSTSGLLDMLHALQWVDPGNRQDFKESARCTLLHDQAHFEIFEAAFDLFWQQQHKPGVPGPPSPWRLPADNRGLEIIPPGTAALELERDRPEQTVLEAAVTYSPREVLRRKDFADLSSTELEEIQHLIAGMRWQVSPVRTRRFKPGSGSRPDLRRTLRLAHQAGGEIVQWHTRAPRTRPRPLLALADISGSMARYTRLFLHFLYALSRSMPQQVETFVFGTRLTRLTRHLQARNTKQAMRRVSQEVGDWEGGTRIGTALKSFNFSWKKRVLPGSAVVLLISDGWDRGDPALLTREIARLQRSCHRLVWLNPLLGQPGYEPLTRGMQAALPHIDDFLPVHNLQSLENLAALIENIQG